ATGMTAQDVRLGTGLQAPDVDGIVLRSVGQVSPVGGEDNGTTNPEMVSAGQVGALAPCRDVPQLAGVVLTAEEKARAGSEYVAGRRLVGNAQEHLRVFRRGLPRPERPVRIEHQQAPAVRAEPQLPDGLSSPGKNAERPAGCRVPDANFAVFLV